MRIQSQELDAGHREGALLLVRSLLDEAVQALGQLEDEAGEEALHDFRVSLRRLRSLLRAFRPCTGATIKRKHERHLREIAAATSGARDAEVQLAWLQGERGHASPKDAPAYDWLQARLERARRTGYAEATRDLAPRFHRLAGRLEKALGRPAEAPDGAAQPTLGEFLAALLRDQSAALATALEAVGGPFEVERAHAARIAAKRLRYLLEPLRGNERADAAAAVAILKELQDLLGELHDAHVLSGLVASLLVESAAERARQAHAAVLAGGVGGRVLRLVSRDAVTRGLLSLDGRLVERATAAHAGLTRAWLPARREALARAVAAVGGALSPPPVGRLGSHRQFLLLRVPDGLAPAPDLEIEEGWVPGPAPRERLIRVTAPSGPRYLRATGASPVEEELSEAAFAVRWPETEGLRLARRRRLRVQGGQRWAIDELGERGPILAEVVAPPGGLHLPRWLRTVLVREVTGERAYQDERIALKLRRARTPGEPAPDAPAGERLPPGAVAEHEPAPGA